MVIEIGQVNVVRKRCTTSAKFSRAGPESDLGGRSGDEGEEELEEEGNDGSDDKVGLRRAGWNDSVMKSCETRKDVAL